MTKAPELDIEPLRQWGFAPGSYVCFCSDCGKQHTADKRAWRCLSCAEKKQNHALALVAAALEPWIDLRDESRGVTGFHLNGAIAEWDEFDLPETPDDATAALERVKQEVRNEALRKASRLAGMTDDLAAKRILALITEG